MHHWWKSMETFQRNLISTFRQTVRSRRKNIWDNRRPQIIQRTPQQFYNFYHQKRSNQQQTVHVKWRKPSRENWAVLRQWHLALWHPAPCNIRGACLGKYWGWKGIMNGNGLTSMILNFEYFAIFYKHFWGLRVLWRKGIMT